MKKLYTAFLLVLLAALLGVGIYSLADQDAAGSASEKREFVRPEFSVRALLDGTYIPALEQYYSDTFPGRETLLNANRTLNKFYYYSGSGEDSVLIVNQTDAAAHGGEALDAVQKANGQTAPEAKPPAQEAPAAEPSPYSPEVQAVIQEGRTALKEMGRLYASIPNPEIRSRINELMSVSDKIIRDAIDDPADVPQIRKFLDFYLPTTIRLLNAYDRMSAQEFGGENITGSMQRIEEMLDTTIAAYKKQLDALFANQAADIQMDIDTMNTMLAREGLGGKGYLDIKDFMKQYEQQQSAAEAAPAPASDTSSEQTMKGSTSHG